MFRTSILKAAALATLSISVTALGAGASMADSYGGYRSNHGNGYGAQYRAPTHVKHRIWKQHVAWCYDRFATYNAADNTYQPYGGPRRQCRSPYYG